mmetsp:Transcript_37447/g.95017  ORF Transcript_37447/g.95017 Transcript_37447/m.95017 type:complete len:255 (-) Transcript_37447:67-831(-)
MPRRRPVPTRATRRAAPPTRAISARRGRPRRTPPSTASSRSTARGGARSRRTSPAARTTPSATGGSASPRSVGSRCRTRRPRRSTAPRPRLRPRPSSPPRADRARAGAGQRTRRLSTPSASSGRGGAPSPPACPRGQSRRCATGGTGCSSARGCRRAPSRCAGPPPRRPWGRRPRWRSSSRRSSSRSSKRHASRRRGLPCDVEYVRLGDARGCALSASVSFVAAAGQAAAARAIGAVVNGSAACVQSWALQFYV